MNKDLKHYLHQLHGKSYPEEIVIGFESYLPESYDFLVDCTKNIASENQASNAMLILFHLIRVKCPGNRQKFFNLVEKNALNEYRLVRSTASQLLVQLCNFAEKSPEGSGINIGSRYKVDRVLEEAIDLGLETIAENYICDYLQKKEVSRSPSGDQ